MSSWDRLGKLEKLLSIVVALIAIAGASMTGLRHVDKPKSASAQTTFVFSGIVRDLNTGKAIERAQLVVGEGQDNPQVVTTDSSGSFRVQIQAETKLLSLQVSANGYKPASRNANPHRTGPEIIDLEPLPSHAGSQPPKKHRPKTQSDSTVATTLPPSKPLTTINQQCSNGPCIGQLNGNLNVGPSEPPDRVISQTDGDRAVETLKKGPHPAKIRIDTVGNTSEMQRLEGQLAGIFAAGGWTIQPGIYSGTLSETYSNGAMTRSSHGEGAECSEASTASARIAAAAVRAAGVICPPILDPQETIRFAADWYIRVGPKQQLDR